MMGKSEAAPKTERSADSLFTVNGLAEELGVTPRAIRFYEAKGLIAPRRAGTTRVFDRRDRARLLLILRGKRLGFSLAEIREYLDLHDAPQGQVRQIRVLLAKAQERIAKLEQQRRDLDQSLAELREVARQAAAALAASSPHALPEKTKTGRGAQ